MKSSSLIPCVLSVLLSTGCTYSVHPILRDSDLTADLDLSGTWELTAQELDRYDLHSFSMQSVDGGANYRGSLDDGKEFAARIGKLGGQRYFEFSIVEHHAEQPALLSSVPVYGIARIETVGDTLRFFPIGYFRAIPIFDKHNIPYRLIERGAAHCVLTADTATLQKLLTDHSDELFSESAITFARKPADPSSTNATESETESAEVSDGQAAAIRKLEFLVGTWKYVESENAPPSPQTRTITMQPDGLSLTMTTESVLGKGQPIHTTYDVESQEYRLTHTDSSGDKRIFIAQLSDGNRLAIRHLEGKKGLFSDLTQIVTVTGDTWTFAFEQPHGKDPFLTHTFQRQRAQP